MLWQFAPISKKFDASDFGKFLEPSPTDADSNGELKNTHSNHHQLLSASVGNS